MSEYNVNQLSVNENLISRKQAIEKVKAFKIFAPTDGVEKTLNAVMEAIVRSIAELPVAEVRRGRWNIEAGVGKYCTACGFDIGNELDFMEYVNFCPNCGALMVNKDD